MNLLSTTTKLNESRPVISIPANEAFQQPSLESMNKARPVPQSNKNSEPNSKQALLINNKPVTELPALQTAKNYSSHDSNLVFSDQNSVGNIPASRGNIQKFITLDQQRVVQPGGIQVQKITSSADQQKRGKSHSSKDNTDLQIQNQNQSGYRREGTADNRANKIQKTAYDKRKNWAAFPMKTQNMNQLVQIRKRKPKMKYFDKIVHKAQQERQIYSQQVQHRTNPKRFQKILDGFLLLYSCRVKLPHEAIRSKLSGENIVDVREEDLVYFKQNLKYLDISDNSVYMEQLTNLQALEELDLQYNNLDHIELQPGAFPHLAVLHLSYNKIPPSHLQEFQYLAALQVLNIASNDFCTLPTDLSFLKTLEEIDLSSNNFSSDSVLVNPSKLFAAISTIPNLKKLNLSRNKFKAFHAEDFPQDNLNQDQTVQVFPHLQEINFAFNIVESQEDLLYCAAQLPSLQFLIVTGNPFAIRGDPEATETLETILAAKGGRLINETLNPPTYLRRQKSKRQDGRPPLMLNYNFPQSREMMVISDNPFPRQKEDLFPMPADETEQIQAIEYQPAQQENIQEQEEEDQQDEENKNQFFITEDQMIRGKNQKKQRMAQDSEPVIEEENTDPNSKKNFSSGFQGTGTATILHPEMNQQQDQIFDEDFGRLKLERFKQQCREILGRKKQDQYDVEFDDEEEQVDQVYDTLQRVQARDYDTVLDIVSAYKTLKQVVVKPSTIHGPSNFAGGSKGYLKMTIAATQHSKSKVAKEVLQYSLAAKQNRIAQTAESGPRALIFAGSSYNSGDTQKPEQKRPTWRKSKQEVVDEKVERLFESYKLMDDLQKKQMAISGMQEQQQKQNAKNKYFPEDED